MAVAIKFEENLRRSKDSASHAGLGIFHTRANSSSSRLRFPSLGKPKCKEILRKTKDSESQAGLGIFHTRAKAASSGLGFPSLGVAKM